MTGPSARLETSKNVLSYPNRHHTVTASPLTPLRVGSTGSPRSPKTANIAKMAEKCKNYISARPIPPHTTPWSRDPETLFRLQIEKNQKIHDFRPGKKGGSFFRRFGPPHLPQNLKKWVSSGGGLGGSGPKTHWGMRLLDKIMILQGVKPTIQPLGVGYTNSPKKAQKGGVCGVFPYIRACVALI